MNYTLYRLIAVIVSAVFGAAAYICKKKNIRFDIIRRIFAVVLLLSSFVFTILHKEAISIVIGLNRGPSPFGDSMPHTAIATFLLWFTYTAIFITAFAQFTKRPIVHYITQLFAFPVFILDVLLFETLSVANIGNSPSADDIKYLLFIIVYVTVGLALTVSEFICVKLPKPTVKQSLLTIGGVVISALVTMPTFVPQVLFGFKRYKDFVFSGFSSEHRVTLYFAVLLPLTVFHVIKNMSIKTKRFAMIFASLGILWSYFAYYTLSDLTNLANLPLGICSIAIILMPIALIFKKEALFNCCLLLGALTALTDMLFPSVGSLDVASTESVRFWISSYYVFGTPILCSALKLFKRPRIGALLRAINAFGIYFLITLIFNAVINNYTVVPDYLNFKNNYLLSAFPEFAEYISTISFGFSIGTISISFSPIYDLTVYISYVLLIVLMWFVYKILFGIWDKSEDRRLKERDYNQMKKDLKEFLGAKSPDTPLYGDNSPKLVLRMFSKKYGNNKHYSVDHVSFSVKGGEIFGFLGPNGAGKSTIIKSIVGIQTITSGSIEVCGYDVERQSVQAKLNTGFVPDHYALYENLTGREYINYIADLYDVDKKTRDEAIEKYVARFQLLHSFDNPMKTYSHGMKQKIAIMAALVHNPKVWILDEPLTGLDPNSIYEVKECMKEHASKGNIVFFSSHIIDVVEKICDKIAIIKGGRLRAAATMAELEANNIDLEELYLHVITADEDEDIINIGGNEILNVADAEDKSSMGVGAV